MQGPTSCAAKDVAPAELMVTPCPPCATQSIHADATRVHRGLLAKSAAESNTVVPCDRAEFSDEPILEKVCKGGISPKNIPYLGKIYDHVEPEPECDGPENIDGESLSADSTTEDTKDIEREDSLWSKMDSHTGSDAGDAEEQFQAHVTTRGESNTNDAKADAQVKVPVTIEEGSEPNEASAARESESEESDSSSDSDSSDSSSDSESDSSFDTDSSSSLSSDSSSDSSSESDISFGEAAEDLGATNRTIFFRQWTWPLRVVEEEEEAEEDGAEEAEAKEPAVPLRVVEEEEEEAEEEEGAEEAEAKEPAVAQNGDETEEVPVQSKLAEESAALTLQKIERGRQARKLYRKRRSSALVLQSWVRGKAHRLHFQLTMAAIQCLQIWIRKWLATKTHLADVPRERGDERDLDLCLPKSLPKSLRFVEDGLMGQELFRVIRGIERGSIPIEEFTESSADDDSMTRLLPDTRSRHPSLQQEEETSKTETAVNTIACGLFWGKFSLCTAPETAYERPYYASSFVEGEHCFSTLGTDERMCHPEELEDSYKEYLAQKCTRFKASL